MSTSLSTGAVVCAKFPTCLHRELLSWGEVLRPTLRRSAARCHSSTALSIERWSQEKLRLFHWSWSSHTSCKRFVFLSEIDCPVVSSPLPRGVAFWNQRSATSWEHSQFLNRVPRCPSIELDDFTSSIMLAESSSLIHTKASVRKLTLEQTSLLKFIFQITSELEFRNFSNSMISPSFFLGTPLFSWLLCTGSSSGCCNRRSFSCSW